MPRNEKVKDEKQGKPNAVSCRCKKRFLSGIIEANG